jgi:outer membrane protein OmpA-like peptidoglycan-associated protein
MRTLAITIALASAWHAGLALAQRRPATEAEALSYITSAFVSQADPGAMSPRVAIGPELEKALGLQPGTDRVKVYQAVVPLAEDPRLVVRRAAPADVAAYGMRRGLAADAPHPLFTVAAGKVKLLVQYDLQALNILYVGQLGLPDPDPRPVAKLEPVAVAPSAPAPKKAAVVNVAWIAEFPYGSAELTPEARAKLDSEIVPKLIASKEIRYLHVHGHSDRMGSAEHNRRLSEKRAEAVRAHLVAKGVDPDKIEVFGYGQTLPVKSCTEEKERSALIECLAPNRRIVVEIQATP